MPRPTSKNELLQLSQSQFKKLNNFVDSLGKEEQLATFPEGTLNRSIRDVLAHLHHWHVMMANWYEVGMRGEKPDMPAKGYTWKTVPDLNKIIQQKYSNENLDEVRQWLNESFLKLQKIINAHSNDELFQKKYYKWTGTTSLGSYLISATSSHYDWAYKFIKKMKK